ncbi:MAG: hypothetical protein SFV32_01410 [Opitutaceae bacterium]|nr:hypothetical protein [Opitutaceae bacterium]
MADVDFDSIVEMICKEDGRFDRRAYDFVRQGLDYTVKEIRKQEGEKGQRPRHVSGKELANGLRSFALEQYGPLSKTVLNAWGLTNTQDFGDIVFNLIDYHVFSKTDSDRREDFADHYSFEDAFVRPYLPAKAAPAVSPFAAEAAE